MPIYEYQCQSCQHEFEKLQKISDAALTDCPECNTPSLKKKISAAGFRLSGAGWYETDFKSGAKKNLAGEKEASAKTESKSESSSTASKSDSKATAATSSKSNDK